MKTRFFFVAVIGLVATALSALAADWPQFRGPKRDDISTETGLLKDWPKAGPPLAWTFDKAGVGFSGFSIVGGRMYTMGNRDGKDQVICVDTKNGQEVWAVDVGKPYENEWGDGPRCTPTVDGDHLYVLGAQGELICLESAKGAKVWEKNLAKDFQGEIMKPSAWGYCESPLVDGDNLVCCPGGAKGTVIALNKKTGENVWRSEGLTEPASYASILPIEFGGARQYVVTTGIGLAGVSPKDGKLLWSQKIEGFRVAVIPTPVFADGLVYTTADYDCGCALLKLSADGTKAEQVYANKLLQNHHGGVVLLKDHVYGNSGNCNARTKWVCQDLKTGKEVWSEDKKLESGSITYADGRLYLYGQKEGECVIIEPSPDGWKEHGRFKIPHETKANRKKGKIWSHPVIADGHLYLRDNELIFSYDLRANGGKP
jgi:outer membrane protein assembly factor BamB